MRKKNPAGPSPQELKTRIELDRLRREVRTLKQGAGAAPPAAGSAPAIEELERTRTRLSRLYFAQVEENRRRGDRLRRLLESLSWLNEAPDLDARLRHVVSAVRAHLGFRRATLRLREPGAAVLERRASAGPADAGVGPWDAAHVPVEIFESWCVQAERISQSALLGRDGPPADPGGDAAWTWVPGMRLVVPIRSRHGELVGDLTVDQPADGSVPGSDVVELLEVLAQHTAAAIENGRLLSQLERHARELEESARRTAELEALKGAFLSSLSQELHAALSAIRAYAEGVRTVREGDLSFDQVRSFLLTVHEESRRLARLSESLLDFCRFDPGPGGRGRVRFAAGEVLEQAVTVLAPIAEAGQVALKLQIAVDDTGLEADRDQVRQLVLHLGRNALRHTPPGGTVTLRLSGDERDLMLDVDDTGVGIPESRLETIFDRVAGGPIRRGEETGLSLAICRSIVEWHGGRIYAESEPGRGACFSAVLPRRSGPRARVATAARADGAWASEQALKLAIEMVAEVMNAQSVTLFEPDAAGRLVARAGTALEEDGAGRALAPGDGVAGWVYRHARPACVAHPAATPDAGEPLAGGAYLCVPLDGGRGVSGVLGVSDPVGGRAFGAADAHLLLTLADRVAAALADVHALDRTAHDLGRRRRELERVLDHLGTAARRAPDRVRLAREVAQALDLPDDEIARVAYAASVHDLGMTEVDPRLTESGAPLAAAERHAVEKHAEIGAAMLESQGATAAVRDIVLAHHEWWDGTGYPRGLAGARIPAGARILAVVDAWSSMTVGRPHRAARPAAAALAELRRRAGSQFDPAVVDAFESVWRASADDATATTAA